MIDSVHYRDIFKVRWFEAFKASDVVPKLLRVGAALMVGINSANRAKIMSGRHRVELIHAELVGALFDNQPVKRDRGNDNTTHAAHGTIAAARALNSIGKNEFQLH